MAADGSTTVAWDGLANCKPWQFEIAYTQRVSCSGVLATLGVSTMAYVLALGVYETA